MQASEVSRALAAVMSIASALGLAVNDAVVLQNSNKLAVRLLPCDTLARVAPLAHQLAELEVEIAQRLAETESPVAALERRAEPRAYERDGFVVTLWTYYEPMMPREVSPADYVRMRLSDCMPACGSSMLPRRISRIASLKLNSSLRAATKLRLSPKRTGSYSAAHCETCDERSPNAASWSSCCTVSRTQATCSIRKTDCCSLTSRRAAVGQSNSTLPTCPKTSASATRTLMRNFSVSAEASFLRWSQHGAGM